VVVFYANRAADDAEMTPMMAISAAPTTASTRRPPRHHRVDEYHNSSCRLAVGGMEGFGGMPIRMDVEGR